MIMITLFRLFIAMALAAAVMALGAFAVWVFGLVGGTFWGALAIYALLTAFFFHAVTITSEEE